MGYGMGSGTMCCEAMTLDCYRCKYPGKMDWELCQMFNELDGCQAGSGMGSSIDCSGAMSCPETCCIDGMPEGGVQSGMVLDMPPCPAECEKYKSCCPPSYGSGWTTGSAVETPA